MNEPASAGPPTETAGAPKRSRKTTRLLGIAVVVVLIAGIGTGAWSHLTQSRQVTATAEQQRDLVPAVRVGRVKAAAADLVVTLPGTTSAFAAANIFARASGYIGERNVDIGDRVKAGQLLATIVAPELDHQIVQAEATLKELTSTLQQRKAARELASVTWERDKPVVQKGWLPLQQGTIDEQTLREQQAAVRVARSNVEAQGRPAQGSPPAEALSECRGALYWRHHAAQHRCRQPCGRPTRPAARSCSRSTRTA